MAVSRGTSSAQGFGYTPEESSYVGAVKSRIKELVGKVSKGSTASQLKGSVRKTEEESKKE